ncbi:MAG: IS3 family transposase [Saccharospirillaceae bacterium]|nr:IS3 family transposase [Saccharospirillaceae bacterium]
MSAGITHQNNDFLEASNTNIYITIAWKQRKDAELCILDYLAYYNRKWPHTTLGYLSPMEFEQ